MCESSQPEIYALLSNFEPQDPNAKAWQFWKRWNRPLLGPARFGPKPAPSDAKLTDAIEAALG